MTTPFKPSAVQPFFWEWVTAQLRGDLGTKIEVRFKAKFRRPEQEEVADLIERIMDVARSQFSAALTGTALGAPASGADTAGEQPVKKKPLTDQEVIDKYLLAWDQIVGDDDQPLPYTPDNMERLEKLLGVRAAVVSAFLDTFMKAPEKNSGPQLGTSTR